MTVDRCALGIVVVVLATVAVGTAGAAVPAAGAMDTGDRVAGGPSDSHAASSETIAGPATANHSAINLTDAVNESWSKFRTANQSLANSSAELDGISDRINNNSRYSDDDHSDARQTLRRMDNETSALNRAANESIRAVYSSDNATPAQKFMAYQAIESHRSAGERQANQSVQAYEGAISENRADTESKVTVRFAGGIVGGVLIGAALGAIIPFREARNVEEQLKLSRNVSYNRRAALLPVIVGFVLLVGGIALLLYLIGGIDPLGVIL